MVIDRAGGSIVHRRFFEIGDYLRPGDVMVFNDSRVIPARLAGKRAATGGKAEILLLRRREPNVWEALIKPAKRLQPGASVEILRNSGAAINAEIISAEEGGVRVVRFPDESALMSAGQVALPPYIHLPLADKERYQTVYSRVIGSVAAPTAGLHFTPPLLSEIEKKGVKLVFVTLHIGLDTFRPVNEEDPREHKIHREYGALDEDAARELTQARREGRRIISVGTTAARLLEHAAGKSDSVNMQPFRGWVDLFILPGHRFRAVDALVTNFHLPRSTLLMLVSAFAGKDLIDKAYREAIAQGYRFYSFGDAMMII
jgi:S-adenosylmethionine:tRNA ribosyltransferase-isomerase